MKKIALFAATALLLFVVAGCKNKNQAPSDSEDVAAADSLSTDSIAEVSDTVPQPVFLFSCGKYLQMLYWTNIEEPRKTKDNEGGFDEWYASWSLQEKFRKSAKEYTNVVDFDGKTTKIRFVDELLKDPDGNVPSIGELHGREEIPSLCARFELVDGKGGKSDRWSGCVAVTDSYLTSRQLLKIKFLGGNSKIPASVLKLVEQKYGMKVSRSMKTYELSAPAAPDGSAKRYIWGALQFKGEYKDAPKPKYDPDHKSCLALDVLYELPASGKDADIAADKVLWKEQIGIYLSEEDYGWNVDDEGEYVTSNLGAAFEGPKGIELCFRRTAPESTTVGMFVVRNGKLTEQIFDCYHNMIDEDIPVWKKDFEAMRKLFLADDPHENKYVELTKWSHFYLNYENEWIWLRDAADENGALFLRKDGKFTLVGVETPKLKPSEAQKNGIAYLCISGSAGGPSTFCEIKGFKDGKQVERFTALSVYGEIDEATFNGKTIGKAEAQTYMDNLPEFKDINAFFREIDTYTNN